jgi:HSP20 family protein
MTQSGTRQKIPLKTSLFRSCDESGASRPKKKMVVPAANVDETKDEYILTIASPGFKREDFQVMVEKDIITIAAAKEASAESCIHDRCEYDYDRWKRNFSLPDDADALMTRARYRNGELIIRIPRGKTDKSFCITTIYVY